MPLLLRHKGASSRMVKEYTLRSVLQSLLFFLVLPLLPILISQLIYFGNISDFLNGMREYTKAFLLNYCIFAALLFPAFLWARRLWFLIYYDLLCVIVLVLSMISRVKLDFRNTPFLWSDLALASEALDITKGFNLRKYLLLFIFCGLMQGLFCFLLYRFRPKSGISLSIRIPVSAAALFMAIMIIAGFPFNLGNIMDTLYGNPDYRDTVMINAKNNGLLLPMFYGLRQSSADAQEVAEIVANTPVREYGGEPDIKPNVVFILSEAFWDPTLLPNVTFGEDPIPTFHALQQQQTRGTVAYNIFGGNTFESEFELLSGYNKALMNYDLISASPVVEREFSTLTRTFKDYGYETTAMHAYHGWFYNRNSIYKNMGFDRFISCEFMGNIVREGAWLRDQELMENVITELKRGGDTPQFIHCLTMQNHGNYPVDKYESTTAAIAGLAHEQDSKELATYVEGLRHSDKALRYFIDEVQKLGKPTVVVFLGDHLPGLLGKDDRFYENVGFVQGRTTYEDYVKLHTGPLLIWDNFSNTKDEIHSSVNFVGSYLLDRLRMQGSFVNDFLLDNFDVQNSVILPTAYKAHQTLDPAKIESLQKAESLLGTNKAYVLGNVARNTAYVLGFGAISIDKVTPNTIRQGSEGRIALELAGKNLPTCGEAFTNYQEFRKIVINGDMVVQYLPATNEKMTVYIPPEYLAEKGEITLQIKVIDGKDVVLAASNEVTVKVE